MKVFEIFSQDIGTEGSKIDFDLHDDLMVFMNNDPTFYRTKYFPFLEKFKKYCNAGKNVEPRAFKTIVAKAYEDYRKKFQVEELSDTLSDRDLEEICEKLQAKEVEQFRKDQEEQKSKDNELVQEGGWDTTATQGTIINPRVVKIALDKIKVFVNDFNAWLGDRGLGKIEMGRPTGSSAYHEQDQKDDPEKVYGDIDLQMIAPPVQGLTHNQFTAHWNKLTSDFAQQMKPEYIHPVESKPGHPIIKIGDDQFVQVDFMWHEEKLRDWGAARATPERGVKGLLMGNFFSVLGELLDMSIQHAGVQMKVIDNQHVPFSKQKGTKVITITINPKTFIYDIFKYEYKSITNATVDANTKIDSKLKEFPGVDVNNVKVAGMVNSIKGLANSFEMNGMYSKQDLTPYQSAEDFLGKFLTRYEEKAMNDINSKKREKAETPQAIERAENDKKKILSGLEMVKGLFAS